MPAREGDDFVVVDAAEFLCGGFEHLVAEGDWPSPAMTTLPSRHTAPSLSEFVVSWKGYFNADRGGGLWPSWLVASGWWLVVLSVSSFVRLSALI
jgi:hypothetical protein